LGIVDLFYVVIQGALQAIHLALIQLSALAALKISHNYLFKGGPVLLTKKGHFRIRSRTLHFSY
jgi:hypothetical protein